MTLNLTLLCWCLPLGVFSCFCLVVLVVLRVLSRELYKLVPMRGLCKSVRICLTNIPPRFKLDEWLESGVLDKFSSSLCCEFVSDQIS